MELLAYVSWGKFLALVVFTAVTIVFGIATSDTDNDGKPQHTGWILMILLWAFAVYLLLDNS